MPTPTQIPGGVSGFTVQPGQQYSLDQNAPPAPAPINRTTDTPLSTNPGADAAQTYLDTFQAPQTADQIAEGKRRDAQALIDSTNRQYDTQVADAKVAGQDRTNQNNSISVLSGLMGSTEAVRTDQAVSTANQKAIDAVNQKRALDLQGIYTKISSDAQTEAQQQKQDATSSAKDIVARRADVQAKAVDNIKQMAAGGLVDFESFKSSPQNAQVYQHALDSVGGSEDALKAIFAINRPQDQIVGTPTRVGDHFVQAYKNPITGKVSFDTINLPGGLPQEYKSFQKLGDNIVAIPDGWNGDTSQLKTIAGTPSQSDLLDQEYKRAQISNMNDPLDKEYKKAQIANLNDPTDKAYKQAQIDSLRANTKKTLSEVNGGGTPAGYNGEFEATVKLAANQGGTNAQRAQTANTLQSFIANKDYPSAYAAISDATAKGLKGTAATTFAQQQNSLGVLDSLHSAMKAYSDAGGNTNVFKGTVDQVQNKIGKLMTDPKYASLAVQMNAAFQNYRLQMTGAAFSPAESAEYAAILPSPGNTLDLNLAKLTGAKAYLNSSVESSIKSVVGQGGVYIKQYAEGAQPASQQASKPSNADPLGLGI